jgi:hypothetical protein
MHVFRIFLFSDPAVSMSLSPQSGAPLLLRIEEWYADMEISFIQQSALRQVQSLLQSELSTQCDLELPPSNGSIIPFP